ncbi:phosphoribosyltransferase [Nocardioides sp. T2.26MG-1]|uniref:phosphoribosyltransferase n=1 Tax=Nocardioides sp. T2.26MG-1 TaxID=3041166 RepID=UPI0024779DB7|nr:phosphoribosyltransferase family protein [Nocardioides sp. T2.26MG-1]CAI9404362.1 Putative phosphoribosyl transferase [Nocardioides sp. T2.26MG-1]
MFRDRAEAGRRLAEVVLARHRDDDLVVLGLPRGGVPVAAEVARAVGAPLDVIVVRKLGLPQQPEVAMGAIGEGGVEVLDADLALRAGVSAAALASVGGRERAALRERVARLRAERDPADLRGRVAVVVDDGVATGSTARVACQVARARGAARVVVAVPVAAPDVTASGLGADELLCVETPSRFGAVGAHYRRFDPTSDDEVRDLLTAGHGGPRPTRGTGRTRRTP